MVDNDPVDPTALWRERMIQEQLLLRDIVDSRVLEAFRKVPRHRFCPRVPIATAYGDHPVDIGCRQTVSQPFIVARMLQAAALKTTDVVLEIGTGSGYQTALLALLTAQVYSVECIPELFLAARERLSELGIRNIQLLAGDGSLGWPERAPFDAIIYSAAAPRLPEEVCGQLKIGGRLIAPVGNRERQELMRIERTAEPGYQEQRLGGCVFVPLRGAYGWSD